MGSETERVKRHYGQVLADIYAWLYGGFNTGIEENIRFFEEHAIHPIRSGIAIDLGAGCGFQSIPLARAGFSVTAIDIDPALLGELAEHTNELPIKIVEDDLLNFAQHTNGKAEVIVCFTDTLLHLESKDDVVHLFNRAFIALEEGGQLVITFRDLSHELRETDRFIPVKSDANTIFTCFLEYEPETVKVHDLVYRKKSGEWTLDKSWYRKLRLSKKWVDNELAQAGFRAVESQVDRGFVTVIATRQD